MEMQNSKTIQTSIWNARLVITSLKNTLVFPCLDIYIPFVNCGAVEGSCYKWLSSLPLWCIFLFDKHSRNLIEGQRFFWFHVACLFLLSSSEIFFPLKQESICINKETNSLHLEVVLSPLSLSNNIICTHSIFVVLHSLFIVPVRKNSHGVRGM